MLLLPLISSLVFFPFKNHHPIFQNDKIMSSYIDSDSGMHDINIINPSNDSINNNTTNKDAGPSFNVMKEEIPKDEEFDECVMVHPLSVIANENPNYLTGGMPVSCLLCGGHNSKETFVSSRQRNGKIINTCDILCSPACKYNTDSTFILATESCLTYCTEELCEQYGIEPQLDRRFPSYLSQKVFGGDMERDEYQSYNANTKDPVPNNPFINRPFSVDDPFWQKDWSGSGMRCWYCKMEVMGKACTIVHRSTQDKQIDNTWGFYHRQGFGGCAMAAIYEQPNLFTRLKRYQTQKMLSRAPFNIPYKNICRTHDKRVLQQYMGFMTPQQFLSEDKPRTFVYLISEHGQYCYPYYSVRINKQELTFLSKNKVKDNNDKDKDKDDQQYYKVLATDKSYTLDELKQYPYKTQNFLKLNADETRNKFLVQFDLMIIMRERLDVLDDDRNKIQAIV